MCLMFFGLCFYVFLSIILKYLLVRFFKVDFVSLWCNKFLGDMIISGFCNGCIVCWWSMWKICVGVVGMYIWILCLV